MRKVSKKERWNFVKNEDAVVVLQGKYPYEVHWRIRSSGKIIAKDIPVGDKYEYYVKDK